MQTRLLSLAFLLAFLPCADSTAQAPQASGGMKMANPAGKPGSADKLKISYGEKSVEFTPKDLALLDHQAIDLVNGHTNAKEHYSGVLLSSLLTRVGVPDKPHGKDFRLYLVAEGADGYQVVYSLGEVTPDIHDGTVIVADTLGGATIAEDGPFKLVALGEKHPARWVRNLVSIRVLSIP